MGHQNVEQLGFSPVPVKQTTSPEAGKVHECQADQMIDHYPGSFSVPITSSNTMFLGKVDFL